MRMNLLKINLLEKGFQKINELRSQTRSYKMRGKIGSHVGVIASFSIFILFLVAMYFVVEPALKTQDEKKVILDYLETELIKDFSSNFTTVVINPGAGNCSTLSNSLVDVADGSSALAKDVNGNLIGVRYSGSNLIVDDGGNNLWVYYSETAFNNLVGTDNSCIVPEIESIRADKKIFEKNVIDGLVNFEFFKTSLNIPPGTELSVGFQLNNGTIISANEPDFSGEIYVKEANIQYVDRQANSLAGKLIIKAW